ncbi:hypothetical protein [Lysobacter sp. P5_B9]
MIKSAPKSVVAAALLLAVPSAIWLIGAVRSLANTDKYFLLSLPFVAVVCALVVLVTTILVLAIFKRQNWARWLLAAWTLFRVASFAALSLSPKFTVTISVVAASAPYILATLFLFLPSAGSWFRPNNSFKPKPLRGSA